MPPLNITHTPATTIQSTQKPPPKRELTTLYFSAESVERTSTNQKEEGFLKYLWKDLQGPSDLSFTERIGAFFSAQNLSYGFKQAKLAYKDSKNKGLETTVIILEMAFHSLFLGIPILLYPLLPGLSVSNSIQSFFNGVHESAEIQYWENDEE